MLSFTPKKISLWVMEVMILTMVLKPLQKFLYIKLWLKSLYKSYTDNLILPFPCWTEIIMDKHTRQHQIQPPKPYQKIYYHKTTIKYWILFKSRIRETLNLSTDANSGTATIKKSVKLFWGG